MAMWPAVELGVITLPDGRQVRGRGLRHPLDPARAIPDFGVYLLGEPPSQVEWEHRWVRCPDFRCPTDRDDALRALSEGWTRAATQRVEVGCGGGRGRTGIGLAVMAVLSGVTPENAVEWVRANYDKRAIETPWQRRWVANLP